MKSLGVGELEELGKGINSWWSVDAFARTLAGPLWLSRQVLDGLFMKWAQSEYRWWTRAALLSTVVINVRSHGGRGDVERTLGICRLLVDDRDDMVVKAMSWALNELTVNEPDVVLAFLGQYDSQLAACVKREVTNKLTTGLENPA